MADKEITGVGAKLRKKMVERPQQRNERRARQKLRDQERQKAAPPDIFAQVQNDGAIAHLLERQPESANVESTVSKQVAKRPPAKTAKDKLKTALREYGISDDLLAKEREDGLLIYQASLGGSKKSFVMMRLVQTPAGKWTITLKPTLYLLALIKNAGLKVEESD